MYNINYTAITKVIELQLITNKGEIKLIKIFNLKEGRKRGKGNKEQIGQIENK